jgi:DNA repair exonuclease SbcCD ATPase subunit
MRKKRSEIKGSLMREAEAVIDELVAWEEQVEAPDLSQIEEVVLKLRQRLSEKMAEAVIQQQENVVRAPGPACPECGTEMRYKGEHSKEVSSWVGEIQLKRGYYHCPKCKTGLFPPG